MTLIGPFTMTIVSGSTSSSVVSGSSVEAAESLALFSPATIEGNTAVLQGAPNLGVASPTFVDLLIVGDLTIPPGGAITVSESDGAVINPVPATAGFRVQAILAQSASADFDLLGRTAPGVNAANETLVTGSVEVVASTGSVTIDEQPIRVTGSLGGGPDLVVTGSVEVVAEPSAVTRSVSIDAQPIDITGSVEVVAGSVVVTPVGSPAVAATGSYLMGNPDPGVEGEVANIGGKVYEWEGILSDVDGRVQTGSSAAEFASNFINAINLGPGAGTAYAASMTLNPSASATAGSGTFVIVTAKIPGTAGNSIFLGSSDNSAASKSAASLVGGTDDSRVTQNVSGSVEVVAAPLTTITGSVAAEVTGGVVSVLQAADVSLNDPIFVSGSVVVSDISQAEPILVTGSFAVVGVTQVTGSVEVVAEPLAETRSVTIDGQPIDVSGSVVISDLSQTEPVLVTGSVFTAATVGATQSVSLVDSRVTQSVDLVFGDTVNVTNTQSVVIDARAPAIIGPNLSPDGHTVGSFASMSRRELP